MTRSFPAAAEPLDGREGSRGIHPGFRLLVQTSLTLTPPVIRRYRIQPDELTGLHTDHLAIRGTHACSALWIEDGKIGTHSCDARRFQKEGRAVGAHGPWQVDLAQLRLAAWAGFPCTDLPTITRFPVTRRQLRAAICCCDCRWTRRPVIVEVAPPNRVERAQARNHEAPHVAASTALTAAARIDPRVITHRTSLPLPVASSLSSPPTAPLRGRALA